MAYSLPFKVRLARLALRPLFRLVFHLLARVRITGKANVPRGEPYVLIANHVSLFEPPLVLSFWPAEAEAIAAVEIWDRRGQSGLVDLYGAIQVHRGQYDRQALELAFKALESGRPLLIFPEGGRTHRPGLREAQPGVGFLVEKTGVKVVPVGVTGTSDDFLRRALRLERPLLEMRIGKAFTVPPVAGKGEARRAARQASADFMMQRLAAVLPEEYQGVYAGTHPA
jgi:1-acyl-sn-glycerol-3-phosphate acyltransferase